MSIESNLTIAENVNVKIHVLTGGILYIGGNVTLNNNLNICFDEAGTIIIDGNLNAQGFNVNPLDGKFIVAGAINTTADLEASSKVNFWGDNITPESFATDLRDDTGIPGPTEGSYGDFAINHPLLCALSHYCNTNFNTALPVKFLTVEAEKGDNMNVIRWITVQEKNNSHFELEMSENGETWSYVGSIDGKRDSKDTVHYQLSDFKYNPAEIIYYRIKQYDLDGKTSTSRIVYVVQDEIEKTLSTQIYPNPNSGKFYLQLPHGTQLLSIKLISVEGEPVSMDFLQTESLIKIETRAYLNNGFYSLEVITDNSTQISPVVIK